MVDEALASSFEVVEVLDVNDIGAEAMSRISTLTTAPPVVAVVRQSPPSPLSVGPGLYLALDSIRDPGNLGTIIRTADWFGIRTVVASPDTVELYNPKVIQSTMGAVFRVAFHRMPLPDFARKTLDAGGRVYGTFLDGEDIYACDTDNGEGHPVAIVIGNESAGIGAEMSRLVSDRLRIPPFPGDMSGSESLNAAMATGIIVAEFRRRIRSHV